jgi:hypothetical protein
MALPPTGQGERSQSRPGRVAQCETVIVFERVLPTDRQNAESASLFAGRPGLGVQRAFAGCLVHDRDRDEQRRPSAGGTGDLDLAAERLDAVAETDEPRPLSRVGSPDSVVADREQDDPTLSGDLDVHDRRLRARRRQRAG